MKCVRKSLCRRLISGISAFVMALTMMTFALPQSVFAAKTDDIGSINVKFNWVHTGVPETGEAHNLGGGEVVIEYFTGEHTWGNKPVTKQAATFGYNQSSIDIDLRNGYDYITVDVDNRTLGYLDDVTKIDDSHYEITMTYGSKQYTAKQSWIDTTSTVTVPETTFDIEMLDCGRGWRSIMLDEFVRWDEEDAAKVKQMLSTFVVRKTVPAHNKNEETTVVWNLPAYYCGQVTSSIMYKVVQDDVPNYYTKSPSIIKNPTKEKTDWDFVNINTKSTTDLPVKKIWLDEGYENKRPSSVTVGIYNKNNMNTPVKTITMSSADATDAHTWQKNVTLPMIDANSELIEYRLKENKLPNYKTTYDASAKEGYYIDFDKYEMFESGFGVNVVRTDEHGNQVIYSPNSHHIGELMEGENVDESTNHGDTTFTGVVKLYNDMLYQGTASYSGAREWSRASAHFYYDGKDIIETRHPFEQGDGALYEYRLSENSDERLVFVMNTQSWGDYYGFKIKEISPIGNEDTIVNRYINVPIDIPFEKQWDDAGHEDKRPASIEFDLYRNGEKIKSKTVTASNNWKGSFNGEMKYDDNGKAYAYVVREGKAIAKDGNVYKTTYTKPDEPYFNALEIKFKDFRDSELADNNAFPEIYFSDENGWWQLQHHSLTTHYIDGLTVQVPATNFILKSNSPADSFIVQAEYIKPIHLDENLQSLYANYEQNRWTNPKPSPYHQCYYSTTPDDLPLMKYQNSYNSYGNRGYYWKFELEDGYAVSEGEKTVATNKYETIDFPVNKYWNVKDVSTIPVSEVEFELVNAKNPDKVIRTLKVTNQNKQSAPSAYIDGEVWTGTFEGLPKYNSDGTLAVYQVREKSQINGFIADTVNAPIVGTSPYAGAWITLETDTEMSRIPYIYIRSAGGEIQYQDINVSDISNCKFFVPYNYGTNFDFCLFQSHDDANLKVTSYELTTEMPDRDKMNNIYFYKFNSQTPSEEYLIADSLTYIVDGNKIYRNKKDISYSNKAYFDYLGEYNTEEEIKNKVSDTYYVYDLIVENGLVKLDTSKYAKKGSSVGYDYYLIDGKSIPTGSEKFSLQPYGNEENNISKLAATDAKIPVHSVINIPKKVELKVNKVWDYSKANKTNRNIGAVTFQVVNKKNPDVPIALTLNNGQNISGANIKANTFALINPYLIDKMKAVKNGMAFTFTKTPDDYVNVPWNSIYSVTGQSIPITSMKAGATYFLDNLIGDMLYNLPYMNNDGTRAEYLIKELSVVYMDNAESYDAIQKDLADTVTETNNGATVTKNISNTTPTETYIELTKEWEIVKTAISTDNIGGAVFEIYNKKDLNTPLTFYCLNQNINEQIQCSSVMLINPYFVDKSLHSAENGQIVEYTKTPQDFKDALWNSQYVYNVPKSNSAQEIKTFLTDLDANPVVEQPYRGYVPTLQVNSSVKNVVPVPSLNVDGTKAEYVIKEKMLVDMQGNQINNTDFLLLVTSEQTTKQEDIEIRKVALKNTDDTTIDLSFTKVWAGDSDFKARPAKLTFKAYNKKDTEFKNPVQSIEVNTTNDTRKVYTFTGLPKYNDDSTLAEYVVREDAVSKYTTSYSADGLTVTNTRKYGKILLVKDNEGSKIAGTQFGIYSNSTCTNLVSTITTDGQGVARSGKLEYGTYYVKETKAIDGYTIKRTVYKATINSNGICYITKANNTSTNSFNENLTGVVAIENKQNRLEISKVDASDEHTLEGAVLALYNSSGEEIERWTTTNEKKVFKGLSYGNYTIKELKAPKGYNTAEDIKVTITEDTETLSVKMYDSKGIEMPETGGAGRTGVYVISLILLLAGTIYLVHTKKAEKE